MTDSLFLVQFRLLRLGTVSLCRSLYHYYYSDPETMCTKVYDCAAWLQPAAAAKTGTGTRTGVGNVRNRRDALRYLRLILILTCTRTPILREDCRLPECQRVLQPDQLPLSV